MSIPTFEVELTEEAFSHLAAFKKFERNIILDAIKLQLPYQAIEETRNKKSLRENPLADWELRIQDYRVFYDVNLEQSIVRIVAIGYKEHNRLFIDGEEIFL